jgi:predicted Na+-dependent transporter
MYTNGRILADPNSSVFSWQFEFGGKRRGYMYILSRNIFLKLGYFIIPEQILETLEHVKDALTSSACMFILFGHVGCGFN